MAPNLTNDSSTTVDKVHSKPASSKILYDTADTSSSSSQALTTLTVSAKMTTPSEKISKLDTNREDSKNIAETPNQHKYIAIGSATASLSTSKAKKNPTGPTNMTAPSERGSTWEARRRSSAQIAQARLQRRNTENSSVASDPVSFLSPLQVTPFESTISKTEKKKAQIMEESRNRNVKSKNQYTEFAKGALWSAGTYIVGGWTQEMAVTRAEKRVKCDIEHLREVSLFPIQYLFSTKKAQSLEAVPKTLSFRS